MRCESLVVGWAGRPLLPPMDLAIRRGELVAVVGRNGAGKSTWFKTLLGLIPPVSGHVHFGPAPIHLAYVPQSAALDPILPLSGGDVVAQGRLRGWSFLRPWPSQVDRRACQHALEEAEAAELGRRPLSALSVGQRQRVLFARMLAADADLALLDEPTAAMDVLAERSAVELLARLAHRRRMAIVIVSHSPEVATEHADRVLLLDAARQRVVFGRRAEVADPDLLRRPEPGQPPAADAAHPAGTSPSRTDGPDAR